MTIYQAWSVTVNRRWRWLEQDGVACGFASGAGGFGGVVEFKANVRFDGHVWDQVAGWVDALDFEQQFRVGCELGQEVFGMTVEVGAKAIGSKVDRVQVELHGTSVTDETGSCQVWLAKFLAGECGASATELAAVLLVVVFDPVDRVYV